MPQFDWRGLLSQWSKELIAVADQDDELRDELSPEVRASGWLGFPGATDEQLRAAEDRLGAALPPSYREFLLVTNGWRFPKFSLRRMWSTEEIDWLAVLDQEGIDAWRSGEAYIGPIPPVPGEQYFAYDDDGCHSNELDMRSEFLQSALQISDREEGGTGVYLLIPEVVTPEGEWEAWFWAHWLPGAERYRSFWDMMRYEYKTDIRLPRNKH